MHCTCTLLAIKRSSARKGKNSRRADWNSLRQVNLHRSQWSLASNPCANIHLWDQPINQPPAFQVSPCICHAAIQISHPPLWPGQTWPGVTQVPWWSHFALRALYFRTPPIAPQSTRLDRYDWNNMCRGCHRINKTGHGKSFSPWGPKCHFTHDPTCDCPTRCGSNNLL